ncbi:hypothetical protein, partial [Frankia sp. Cr1]|uniref:hypothetical protein n=1 Tax=Frankia sp. Cr1 TaxID=3073931 RepID=UPI002AD246FF
GTPLRDMSVEFAAPPNDGSGASWGSFDNGQQTVSTVTNDQGVAMAGSFTRPSSQRRSGDFQITATVAGTTAAAAFALHALPDPTSVTVG